MKLNYIIFGCFSLLVLYVSQTVAIKCVQTSCNADKGGYCCKKTDSSTTKGCCCYSSGGSYSQTCLSHSGSFPVWAGVIIGIVVVGIIVGAVVGYIFYKRRRMANMPYTTQT